jgi:hypothetical protein
VLDEVDPGEGEQDVRDPARTVAGDVAEQLGEQGMGPLVGRRVEEPRSAR